MNFKDQLFHSSLLFSSNNILKFRDKITLKSILFVSKSINRQVPSIFYERKENCWSIINHLNIPTFRTQKYGCYCIRASAMCSWNYAQDKFVTQNLNSKKYKALPNQIFHRNLLIIFVDLIIIYIEFIKLYMH